MITGRELFAIIRNKQNTSVCWVGTTEDYKCCDIDGSFQLEDIAKEINNYEARKSSAFRSFGVRPDMGHAYRDLNEELQEIERSIGL